MGRRSTRSNNLKKKLDKPVLPVQPGGVETDPSTSALVKKLLREHRALVAAQESPWSDKQAPFVEKMTKEDCIRLHQSIVRMYPNRKISRFWFQKNSGISESTWNRYFGTFEEYKRQARIKLSRQVHALERSIAKHASVDHYRALNQERRVCDGKYIKDNGSRFKTMILGFDQHDREVDPFCLRVFHKTIEMYQPDDVVFGGDLFDLPEFGRYPVDPREWDVTGRIKFCHEQILAPTRLLAPNTNMHLIEGNHENRLMRHMCDGNQSLRVVLSDLLGMTVSKLFLLDQLQINYVARSDLAAWTKRDIDQELKRNYKIFYDCFLVHHFTSEGVGMAMPGASGHSHKYMAWTHYNPTFGSYTFQQFGCMHYRSAVYTNAEKWSVGFGIVHIDTLTKNVNVEYIPVTDTAYVAGWRFVRQPNEKV